jgi:hypothetical protein
MKTYMTRQGFGTGGMLSLILVDKFITALASYPQRLWFYSSKQGKWLRFGREPSERVKGHTHRRLSCVLRLITVY